MDVSGSLLERNIFNIISRRSLEGGSGRDRMQQCCLLPLFQAGPHQNLFSQGKIKNSASKMATGL